ncbi:hypothetical protein GCM10023085_26980 [Actinomadura viridis]|uniref:PH domain-containing protein n=1 Tax=Actinomadura viridis TaxID=58110 RepID=A0A931DI16_9ACTN|nr:hypothetical protein [Actinomadura viridis]MBG6087315.1 hypothetical protein [Actinomadura viridis]
MEHLAFTAPGLTPAPGPPGEPAAAPPDQAARAPGSRAPESRAPESQAPGSRAAESRAAEFRPPRVTRRERARLWTVAALGVTSGSFALWMGVDGPAVALALLPFCGPALVAGLVLLDLRSATRVGPAGIHDTRFGVTRSTAWHRTAGFEVRRTPSGRLIRVLRRDGRPLTLAAPADRTLARDHAFAERLDTLQVLAAAYRHAPLGVRVRTARGIRPRTVPPIVLALLPPLAGACSPWL